MFSFQTLIQNPFDIHFEFGKRLERQGTVCTQRMLKFRIATYMSFQGNTIIALIPLVPQQKRGTASPLPLPFAPAPPLDQKLEEMDSTDFFPVRMVQDRIPLRMKQDYCSMHTLWFSICGFLLQTTKKSLSKKIGFATTKGLDVYLSECPSVSSARKLVMLSFHRQCKTSQVWCHSHVIFYSV